jgi:hypothetical protein
MQTISAPLLQGCRENHLLSSKRGEGKEISTYNSLPFLYFTPPLSPRRHPVISLGRDSFHQKFCHFSAEKRFLFYLKYFFLPSPHINIVYQQIFL